MKLRVLQALCLLIFFTTAAVAQTTANINLPVNQFLHVSSCCSQPTVNQTELNKLYARTSFVKAQNYATPNDNVNDLNTITSAINAALATSGKRHGVDFGTFGTSGGNYILGSANSTNTNQKKSFTVPSGDTLVLKGVNVWLKANNLSRNTFLEFTSGGALYTGVIIWDGVNIDGNQANQIWPGNPKGGSYDAVWPEAHPRMVGFINLNMTIVNNTQCLNTVMDGFNITNNYWSVFNNCYANGGAPIWYDKVGDQGTYFKVSSNRYRYAYFMNVECYGGSIGCHISFPTADQATLMVNSMTGYFFRVKCYNQAQDNIHIEDCWNVVFRLCDLQTDTEAPAGQIYQPRIHISNQTRVAVVDRCNFRNVRVNFNEAGNLQLGIIRNSTFLSEYATNYLPNFIFNATNVLKCTFKGKVKDEAVQAKYVKLSSFDNWGGGYGITGSSYTDSCTFSSATKAIASGSGNFYNTLAGTYVAGNATGSWQTNFSNHIDLYRLNLDNSTDLLQKLVANQ